MPGDLSKVPRRFRGGPADLECGQVKIQIL